MKNTIAKQSLIKFTEIDPTLLPADSKDKAVIVQQTAVRSAAISPILDSIIYCVL